MSESNNQYPQSEIRFFIDTLSPEERQSFSSQQLTTIQSLLEQALTRSKPKPKLVDLRFVIDLFFARYYFVLFVGRDQRAHKRKTQNNKISQLGNLLAAILLLIALNLLVSSILFLIVYLLKSLAGIDLFPGHLGISE